MQPINLGPAADYQPNPEQENEQPQQGQGQTATGTTNQQRPSYADGVVLITGGTSGIGLATAIAAIKTGAAKVIVCGRSRVKWIAAQAIIAEANLDAGSIDYLYADVRVEDDIKRVVNYIYDIYGRLDVCVNAAGVYTVPGVAISDVTLGSSLGDNGAIVYSIPAPQPTSTVAQPRVACPQGSVSPVSPFCENAFLTSAMGTLYSLKHQVAACQRRQPHNLPLAIVNLSSQNAERPASGAILYSAGKAVVSSLTQTVATQVALKRPDGVARPSIRVNAVAPGPVRTPLLMAIIRASGQTEESFASKTPAGRLAMPREIAEAILFLADNDRSSYVTGMVMAVDGGGTAASF